MVERISVIGDLFMLSDVFEQSIRNVCPQYNLDIRKHDLPWPDQPMEHGYASPALSGLKEFMGRADDIVALIDGASMLVTHLAPLSRAMMEQLPDLRFVAVSRGGPVNIDMNAAHERGLRVVNAPGRNATAVAEFTIGAILAETRNITRGHDALRRGQWRGDLYRADMVGPELSELIIGIVGYGEIGRRVVSLLKAFGARIVVCDPYVQLTADDLHDGVVQIPLDRLLAEADIVSLHPRVTPETTGMINASALVRMKQGAYLINTARGPLVDLDALHDALIDGRLRGAVLETFAAEPIDSASPLLKLDNVTLTPHIAGASRRTIKHAADLVAHEVRRYLAQEPPLNPC